MSPSYWLEEVGTPHQRQGEASATKVPISDQANPLVLVVPVCLCVWVHVRMPVCACVHMCVYEHDVGVCVCMHVGACALHVCDCVYCVCV